MILINHISDNRYDSQEYIVSHNKKKYQCYKIKYLEEILDKFKFFDAKFILIDEG